MAAVWLVAAAAAAHAQERTLACTISDSVDIPHGSGVTYHLTATVQALPESPVHNTATVAAGSGETDVNLTNNSASATDAVGIFETNFGGP